MTFKEIVHSKLFQEELNWLNANSSLIKKDEQGNQFILNYSLIFRFISKDKIEWSTKELLFLKKQYPSFSEEDWNKQSLCRSLLMIELPVENSKVILKKLVETCSINEQEDFYKSLYFLKIAPELTSLVEEGIRTNVENVFDAIALNNPYAANYLSEEAWNQLVLKAIFMGRPLYKIYNLVVRNNEKLAVMLNNYIQERWSAGRKVSPEIWQLMLGYKHPDILITLKKAIASTNELEHKAVQIILQETTLNRSSNLAIWTEIGKKVNQNK
ncbi:EboA domain-containing protein [Aquimarina agarilytica]|uniref:EboA domain-containing protein n=1 Tax=Aquimarina agarilytica TaxID=1087449 RepID=UPI0018DED0EB|nr:EboA domain-containing protein [Aquimarina agarilytica]